MNERPKDNIVLLDDNTNKMFNDIGPRNEFFDIISRILQQKFDK